MFQRVVYVTLDLAGEEVRIPLHIGCNPSTPDKELERRAGNILRAAANDATYEVGY